MEAVVFQKNGLFGIEIEIGVGIENIVIAVVSISMGSLDAERFTGSLS
jgi:hypothetical protein